MEHNGTTCDTLAEGRTATPLAAHVQHPSAVPSKPHCVTMLRRAVRRAGSWGAALHQGGSPGAHGFASSLHALPCITAVPFSGGHGVAAGVRAAAPRNSLAGFAARGLHTAQPSPSSADDLAAQRDLLRLQAEQVRVRRPCGGGAGCY